jgi:type I restriction enzyme S subunit
MSDELPKGWISLTLADVVEPDALIQYGILQPGPDIADGIPYIRPTEIREDCIDEASLRRTTREIAANYRRSSLKAGDVLLSIVGSIGKVAIVPSSLEGANITQSSARLRPRNGLVSSEILAWFLRSPLAKRQFDEAELGTGVPRLNIGDIRQFVMPIAPTAEQRRIVVKVEDGLANMGVVRARLARLSDIVNRLRQSVFASACSGRLTEDWRGGADTESWSTSTVSELAENIQYGYTTSAKEKSKNGPRFLRITDIQDGRVSWDAVPGCEITPADERKFQLRPGDIVFARTGATTGKSFLIQECPRAVFASYLIRVRPGPLISPSYLYVFLRSPEYWAQVTESLTGNAQPGCNASKLGALSVPVPPLAEQREIVRRVDGILALAATVEIRVTAASARADRLAQAILAKAFRGDLVPTEAELAGEEKRDYEPAVALLERVRGHAPSEGRESRQPLAHAEQRDRSAEMPGDSVLQGRNRGSKRLHQTLRLRKAKRS